MSQPLISIIITILNGEKTLNQCLNSIVNQTFTDYEVIIVDGGSTDNTLLIINESKLINKTVRVVPGIGLYAGLNAGTTMATGEWFYFMGCDDELNDSDTLQKVANVMTVNSRDFKVVVGNVHYVRQEFIFRPRLGSPNWFRYNVHHQGMFYNRSIFVNLHYDEGLLISADYELNLKLALNNVPHRFIDIIVCIIGEDGISNTRIGESSIEINKIHKRLFKGITRQWVVNYFKFQRAVLLTRRRYNLVNLKNRASRFIRASILWKH